MCENKKLYTDAITLYGKEHQTRMAMEEMAECTAALCHYLRGRDTIDHVCEEIADAQIMLEQMALLFDPPKVIAHRYAKISRLAKRVEDLKKQSNEKA